MCLAFPCVQYTFTGWRKDSFSPASSVISERFKTSTLMADKCPSRQGRERETERRGEIEKIWLKLEHCYQPLCLTSSCSGVLRATSIQKAVPGDGCASSGLRPSIYYFALQFQGWRKALTSSHFQALNKVWLHCMIYVGLNAWLPFPWFLSTQEIHGPKIHSARLGCRVVVILTLWVPFPFWPLWLSSFFHCWDF